MPVSLNGKLIYFGGLLIDPYVLLSFFLAFLSALSWMATVTKFELNFAYPLLIVSLLLLTVSGSTVLFQESFTVYKFIGIVLISVGVIVLIWSK
jgi:multidrug transporter EmrE-like cation transporter